MLVLTKQLKNMISNKREENKDKQPDQRRIPSFQFKKRIDRPFFYLINYHLNKVILSSIKD